MRLPHRRRARSHPAEAAHGVLRGTVAAMAMSGMRMLRVDPGLFEQPPPEAIFTQKAPGLLRRVLSELRRRPQA